jgi:biotin-(acetyl-CoA carboxylase) ligase
MDMTISKLYPIGKIEDTFNLIQPTQVHLNYEARKKNPDIVINAGVNYVTAPDNAVEDEEVEEEDETDEVEEVIEKVENNELNIKLMMQIISLLQQLLKLKLAM